MVLMLMLEWFVLKYTAKNTIDLISCIGIIALISMFTYSSDKVKDLTEGNIVSMFLSSIANIYLTLLIGWILYSLM